MNFVQVDEYFSALRADEGIRVPQGPGIRPEARRASGPSEEERRLIRSLADQVLDTALSRLTKRQALVRTDSSGEPV